MSKVYETVIGLEVHVELASKTKIFCGCSTAFGGAPNSHTCPVCTGMPGSLPVLNKQVVEYAIAVGLATNCSITQYCKFDRKNYFYPDNPQNYQISQLYLPICRNGGVEIETAAGKKTVGIHEIHMEEDAGKLVHDEWEDCSIVRINIMFENFLKHFLCNCAVDCTGICQINDFCKIYRGELNVLRIHLIFF
jgi:aspartyl-tRNA(Asn)/glutamyl-tRNA(Gln) amidotransferase subunit B